MFKEEVARGMALLDEKRPGWRAIISLPILNLSISSLCVLGQLYDGDYQEGLDHLFSASASPEERQDFALAHGFDVSRDGNEEDIARRYEALHAAWIAALESEKP